MNYPMLNKDHFKQVLNITISDQSEKALREALVTMLKNPVVYSASLNFIMQFDWAVERPELIVYDINGDGKFNARDPALFMRCLAGWDVADEIKNPEAMDVNGDGTVNMRDLVEMTRLQSGWC